MRIPITPHLRLFVDIEAPSWSPMARTSEKSPLSSSSTAARLRPLRLQTVVLAPGRHRADRQLRPCGHGRSDRCPPEEWTLDTFADDVVRLCDALGIEKPIVLGQSFGGFVAQLYIERHPGHAAKVILSSTRRA